MKRLILLVIPISFLLIGCSTTNTIVEIEEPIAVHPLLPKPVKPMKLDIKSTVIDNKPYLIMDVKDSQNLRIYLEDIFRYIKSINSVVCFYRKDLNEEFCGDKIDES